MIKLNLCPSLCEISPKYVKIRNEKRTQQFVTCLCVVMNATGPNVHILQMQFHQRPQHRWCVANRTMHITVLATVMNFLVLFIWIEEAGKKESLLLTLALLRKPTIATMKHYKWDSKQGTIFLYECLI